MNFSLFFLGPKISFKVPKFQRRILLLFEIKFLVKMNEILPEKSTFLSSMFKLDK